MEAFIRFLLAILHSTGGKYKKEKTIYMKPERSITPPSGHFEFLTLPPSP